MDQRADGLMEARKQDPATEARELEQEVDAIRDELGELVGELDRRRHRVAKPLLLGAVAVVASTTIAAGFLLWRQASERRHRTMLGALRAFLTKD